MGIRKLDFRMRERRVSPWLRFSILGPCTGAGVGLFDSFASILVWIFRGEPDFYFRGSNGTVVHCLILAIAGLVIGLPYGAILLGFERLTGRRIRAQFSIPILVGSTFVAQAITTWIEFDRMNLFPLFGLVQCAEVALGFIISIATSRPPNSLAAAAA